VRIKRRVARPPFRAKKKRRRAHPVIIGLWIFYASALLLKLLGVTDKRWAPGVAGLVGIALFVSFLVCRRLWNQRQERLRDFVRSAKGDICPVCRYPMRVAVGERCPECGTVMDMMRIAKWRLWWRGG
jgi:hypothetical protein